MDKYPNAAEISHHQEGHNQDILHDFMPMPCLFQTFYFRTTQINVAEINLFSSSEGASTTKHEAYL